MVHENYAQIVELSPRKNSEDELIEQLEEWEMLQMSSLFSKFAD